VRGRKEKLRATVARRDAELKSIAKAAWERGRDKAVVERSSYLARCVRDYVVFKLASITQLAAVPITTPSAIVPSLVATRDNSPTPETLTLCEVENCTFQPKGGRRCGVCKVRPARVSEVWVDAHFEQSKNAYAPLHVRRRSVGGDGVMAGGGCATHKGARVPTGGQDDTRWNRGRLRPQPGG
jgi:hypothetical protein